MVYNAFYFMLPCTILYFITQMDYQFWGKDQFIIHFMYPIKFSVDTQQMFLCVFKWKYNEHYGKVHFRKKKVMRAIAQGNPATRCNALGTPTNSMQSTPIIATITHHQIQASKKMSYHLFNKGLSNTYITNHYSMHW